MHLDDWLASGAQELADLARLADGSEEALDELFRRGLEWLGRMAPYDLAAVMVIVEEAGGTFTDRHGERTFMSNTAISSNGLLHHCARPLAG